MPAKPAKSRPNLFVVSRHKRCEANVVDRLERALRLLDESTSAWKEGRRGEAIKFLRQAIHIEERALGHQSLAVASALPQFGAYLMIDGQLAESERSLQRGIGLLGRYREKEKEAVAAQALLAELYLKTTRHPDAEAVLAKALPAAVRSYGPDSPEVARLLHSQAIAKEGQGFLSDALALLEQALAVCEKPGKERADFLPTVLGALVRVDFELGHRVEAMDYLDRLLLMLPDDGDDFDPDRGHDDFDLDEPADPPTGA